MAFLIEIIHLKNLKMSYIKKDDIPICLLSRNVILSKFRKNIFLFPGNFYFFGWCQFYVTDMHLVYHIFSHSGKCGPG
jgi:hypothetical protein